MTDLSTPAVEAGRLSAEPQPVLRVDELTLRPWAREDATDLFQAFQDPDIQRWHIETLENPDAARDRIAEWPVAWAREQRVDWAVRDHEGLVGRVGLKGLQLFEGLCEVAYWVTAEARGRRIAPRIVEAVCGWAFTTIGFHRIELVHSVHNPRSCRVAARAGFELEGTLRQAGNHADGWHDMHLHARLAGGSGVDGETSGATVGPGA